MTQLDSRQRALPRDLNDTARAAGVFGIQSLKKGERRLVPLKTQYQKHQGDGGDPSPPVSLGLANII